MHARCSACLSIVSCPPWARLQWSMARSKPAVFASKTLLTRSRCPIAICAFSASQTRIANDAWASRSRRAATSVKRANVRRGAHRGSRRALHDDFVRVAVIKPPRDAATGALVDLVIQAPLIVREDLAVLAALTEAEDVEPLTSAATERSEEHT